MDPAGAGKEVMKDLPCGSGEAFLEEVRVGERGWSPREVFLTEVRGLGVGGWNIREASLEEVSGPRVSGRPLHYKCQLSFQATVLECSVVKGWAGESPDCLLDGGLN